MEMKTCFNITTRLCVVLDKVMNLQNKNISNLYFLYVALVPTNGKAIYSLPTGKNYVVDIHRQ